PGFPVRSRTWCVDNVLQEAWLPHISSVPEIRPRPVGFIPRCKQRLPGFEHRVPVETYRVSALADIGGRNKVQYQSGQSEIETLAGDNRVGGAKPLLGQAKLERIV